MGETNSGAPAPGTDPNAQPPAPAAPPLPGTAPAPTPPAAPPPPAPRRQQQPPQRSQAPKPFGPAEMKRIRQEAGRILRKELGENVTMDEIKVLLAARGQPAPGATPPGAPPAPSSSKDKKLLEEIAARDAQLAERDARIKKQGRRIDKLKRQQQRESTRMEMRFEARSAGIQDRYIEFALAEYGRLFTAFTGNEASVAPEVAAAFKREPEVDGQAVFAYIKAQQPMIGEQQPVVVPIAPTTAPPASRQPGETRPPVKPPGEIKPAFDAMKLSDEDWAKYRRAHGLP